MKKIQRSFLFFLVTSIYMGFPSLKEVSGQKKVDSTAFYYRLATNQKNSNDLIAGYRYFSRQKEISFSKKDSIQAVYTLRLLAITQHKLGAFYESEATAVTAISILNKLKQTDKTREPFIGLYNHLGIIYSELRNYKKALEYYDKVLALATEPNHINTILNNKAYIYLQQEKYQKANIEFTKIYNSSLKLKDEKQIARALSNLGFVQFKLKHPEALSNLEEALKIRKKINHISGMYSSYIYLTEYYKDYKQDTKALLYANRAYKIGQQSNNSNYKLEALSYILLLDKNPKIKEYKKLADSIAVAKQTSENKFASMKYDFSEEKRKADEAKLKLVESKLAEEKQKRLKFRYLILTLFILLMGIILYFILRSSHKKEELLQIYKTETRISVKVHDEAANGVYQIITKLQGNPSIDSVLIDDLEKIYNKTRDISRENCAINLEANFNETVNDLLVSYKNKDINIITKDSAKINWKRVSKEKKTIIYRILQELMTNMKKHSKASLVVVTFTQNNKLVIKYSDNGVGTENKTHNGLQNAENRISAVKGTIIFDSHLGKGFKATITI